MPADLALGPSLASIKGQLQAKIDAEAENARGQFITPGAGQAMEYMATETDARAFVEAVSPVLSDYPFLEAEVMALFDATGLMPDAEAVAEQIVADADAWRVAGSQIKRIRRAAKMKVDAAATIAAARAAAYNLPWPTPTGRLSITITATGSILGIATLTGVSTNAVPAIARVSP